MLTLSGEVSRVSFHSGISDNGRGISEVPSGARNLDRAIAKSDMHLLGDPARGEPR